MKAYVVDNAKLRHAMNVIAKKRGTNWSIMLREKSATTDSSIRRAEIMFEKNKDILDFTPEEYGLYGIYYEDILDSICTTFNLDREKFVLYSYEKEPKVLTVQMLNQKIVKLEEEVINLMKIVEELRMKLKEA